MITGVGLGAGFVDVGLGPKKSSGAEGVTVSPSVQRAIAQARSTIVTASPAAIRAVAQSRSVQVTGSPSASAAIVRAPLASWIADAGVSVTGSDVNSWTDQTSAFVLSPSASKPTLSTAQFAGLNAIRFTAASNQFLINNTTSALYGAANGTNPAITVVMQVICATAANRADFWKFGSTGGSTANRLDAGTVSTTSLALDSNGATGSATKSYTVADMTAAPHVYAFVIDGTTQTLYVDGVANGSVGNMSMSSARTSVEFLIGAFDNNVFKGDFWIRRLNIYPAAISAAQAASISTAWTGA